MNTNPKLMEQLAAPENLLLAWRSVRGNIPKHRRQRSAGPNGVTLAEFEQDLTTQLEFLQDALVTGRYQPQQAARFLLPKKSGGRREIAVLNISERVAQRAAQQVLEPLWEPAFLDCSFGFRPGLSVANALTRAQQFRIQERRWVVDGDITNCFPSLDHDVLMGQLRRRIRDRRVLNLIQGWLDVGIMRSGLPLDDDSLLDKAQSVTRLMQQGTDWVLNQAADEADPYHAARHEYGSYRQLEDDQGMDAYPDSRIGKKSLARRLAANGLLLGSGWARRQVGKLGGQTVNFVKSPAGRRFLKKSALVSASMAGVAMTAAAAAYLLNRKAGPAPTGVLQGSPLSPLLANIYLHLYDLMITKRDHALVRFADDWVILTPTRRDAETAYKDAEWALGRVRLQLNPEKTHICHPDERVKWLGGVIR